MSETVNVENCSGLGWLALWTFLIMLSVGSISSHLGSIAKSQRRIAAFYPELVDPNSEIIEVQSATK